MAKAKCSNDRNCQLAPRAVGHFKSCPARVTVETRIPADLTQAELDELHAGAQRGEVILIPEPLPEVTAKAQAAVRATPARPWWKFWGRRG